jgi:nitrite reductase/ring-hydroxylating ferredoxin subunit
MNGRQLLCRLDELSDPGSRGVGFERDGVRHAAFVVLRDGEIHAYENRCPHTGAPLDWVEHQFLDADAAMIQCAVHDARFDIASGQCLAGPCPGAFLTALPVVVADGAVWLEE